ncbi:MAG: hypothetical protein KDI55_23830, partial [Anaerolineae bacterium]|nr:hypothetical protein [Anaerolineae bacterium]
MNHHFKSLLSVGALALGSMSVHATPLSDAEVLANWQPEADFITNYNTANWVSSPYGVHSGGNVFGALVSDFVTTGDFQFTAQLTASGDNDY